MLPSATENRYGYEEWFFSETTNNLLLLCRILSFYDIFSRFLGRELLIYVIIEVKKDILIDKIEHEYLLNYSNLVVNDCSWISNPHKYHV